MNFKIGQKLVAISNLIMPNTNLEVISIGRTYSIEIIHYSRDDNYITVVNNYNELHEFNIEDLDSLFKL